MTNTAALDGAAAQRQETAFLFDLDGTLVDSVYQHVLAWREALETEGIDLSVWRIHRKIGMSGGLFTNMLLRETGLELDQRRIERLQRLHVVEIFGRRNVAAHADDAHAHPMQRARYHLADMPHADDHRGLARQV